MSRNLRQDAASEQLRLLFALSPPRGYFPDFLTPYASVDGFEAGLDALRRTPTELLRRDLSVLAAENQLPSSTAALARGEVAVLDHLAESMQQYRSLAISPHWSRIQAAVAADRARRARALLDGGVEGLLTSLRPAMRWESGCSRSATTRTAGSCTWTAGVAARAVVLLREHAGRAARPRAAAGAGLSGGPAGRAGVGRRHRSGRVGCRP
ncbi:hypothetical protein NKG94_29170 [Micromonospora sp. M12]